MKIFLIMIKCFVTNVQGYNIECIICTLKIFRFHFELFNKDTFNGDLPCIKILTEGDG